MTADEQARVVTLIGMLDDDDPDERCDARGALRNLIRSRVVEYRGKLYLSQCGELLVVELGDVLRLNSPHGGRATSLADFAAEGAARHLR